MKLVVITGNTGVGKSTYAHKFLSNAKNPCVFDINGEFKEVKENFYIKETLLNHLQSVYNRTVLIDEATAFFSYRGYNEDLNKLLQLRRHNNHFFLFVYHSLNFVPAYLRRYVNYYVIFQQGVSENILKEIGISKIDIPAEKFKYNVIKMM